MVALDGNATGGLLQQAFGTDMTDAEAICAACGAVGSVAETVVYLRAVASISSGNAHAVTFTCLCSLACRAAAPVPPRSGPGRCRGLRPPQHATVIKPPLPPAVACSMVRRVVGRRLWESEPVLVSARKPPLTT
jgi:hypothetical protein